MLADLDAVPTGLGKDTDRRIADAVRAVEKSLTPARWIDDDHLDPKTGKHVFDDERKAVNELAGIKNPPTWVGHAIDRLVAVDRPLAETAIAEATDPAAAAKAVKELAKGDDRRDDGKPQQAIDHWGNAWKHAVT